MDPPVAHVVSRARAALTADTDWTCRVLHPARVYWYRFIDEHGFASRTGRTLTAPAETGDRPAAGALRLRIAPHDLGQRREAVVGR